MLIPRNYHYLVAGLPDLLMDEGRLKTSAHSVKSEFESNLHPDDFALVKLLFLKNDNTNLLNLLLKNNEEFIDSGVYSRDFLEAQIKEPDKEIYPYLNNFILKFKSGEPENAEVSWEIELENDFYDFLLTTKNEFLKNWFTFKQNLQNITTALVCRDHDLSPDKELSGNNFITQNILRSNSRDFGLTQEFADVEKVIIAWENDNILEREVALDLMKWEWIDEHTFFHYFTIEKLLGFLLQLEMAERWMKLDRATGEKMFDSLLAKLSGSFKLPEEFNFQYVKRK